MEQDLHQANKQLIKENKLYDLEFLCANSNWKSVKPVIIYPQVGSFSKFIIEKYGKINSRNYTKIHQGILKC